MREPQPAGAWRGHGRRLKNETHRSTTDPDARLYRKGNSRAAGLRYLAHDLVDPKSRVILRRRASLAESQAAEREMGLRMVREVLQRREELAIPGVPAVLSADAPYGTGAFVAEVLECGILPHVPLQASEAVEEIPTWKRPTTNLDWQRRRAEKVRIARARNGTGCAAPTGPGAIR